MEGWPPTAFWRCRHGSIGKWLFTATEQHCQSRALHVRTEIRLSVGRSVGELWATCRPSKRASQFRLLPANTQCFTKGSSLLISDFVQEQALPSSCRPIRLLDTTGRLFDKILLAKIPSDVSERGLMGNGHFGFRPKQSTSLQLARLV
jgi:hypothetical protein